MKQSIHTTTAAPYKRKVKSSVKRAQKLDMVIRIVSEYDENRLNALLLFIDPPAPDDFELSDEDKLIISERTARYESGKDKGIPAGKMIKELRTRLRKK